MFQRNDYVIDKEAGEVALVLKIMSDGRRYFIRTLVTGKYRIVAMDRVEAYTE